MKFKARKIGKAKAILSGAASALNIYGSTRSTQSLRDRLDELHASTMTGRVVDATQISQDWQNIGSDLRKVYNRELHLLGCE